MEELNKKFDDLVRTSFVNPLKQAGFKKRALNWTRQTEEFYSLINIQRSQWNSHEQLRFFVNVGLHPLDFDNPPNTKSPKTFEFWARLRSDDLLSNTPGAFEIHEDTPISDLITELTYIVKALVEELNQIRSVELLIQKAFRRRPMDAARTYYAIGQDDAALSELQKLADEFGDQKEFTIPALIQRLAFERLADRNHTNDKG
ncbi:DUF4304 domain-containing protein [Cognatiyoonia sp. IB215182]|uniref:DUF4304 domain-containing protein n=1 Tax=Cognatiyoonia sp. IB215182 TaxID=3097353 RepID=UPI002A0C94F1|nr:DUF4304 domain-containing protein [Cognatiyoonia sp. IB215182]MDX8355366.1 DUF4304 domain-containing protein [Cognatiyoonia sp. IB215182]